MVDVSQEIGSIGKEGEDKKPLNILLVEDDESAARLIQTVLRGHKFTVFDNEEQALNRLRGSKKLGEVFDWVITDKGLKDNKGGVDKEGGFKVAKAIQEEGLGKPFVTLFTGSADEVRTTYSEDQLRQKGIHQVLGKPFPVAEMTQAVDLVRDFGKKSNTPLV